jgi:ferric iron reductase protein FhuF
MSMEEIYGRLLWPSHATLVKWQLSELVHKLIHSRDVRRTSILADSRNLWQLSRFVPCLLELKSE